jgi:transposase
MDVNSNKKRDNKNFLNGLIIGDLRGGKKPKTISDYFGIPLRTIYRKWKRFREEGTLAVKKSPGRPKKTTPREDTRIIREVKKDPFSTCKDIASNIGRPDVSSSTIRRRLIHVGGFKCRNAAKKPFLREVNRIKRLHWARDHLNWTPQQWRKVLWSDESKFEIRYHASRNVWRQENQRYNPKNTLKTVKHDKKVMVWGCFTYGGVGRLYRINDIMRKEHYHNILQNQMMLSARGLFFQDDDWIFLQSPVFIIYRQIFQQDNDPKHTARINRQYLEDKGVTVMDWPPQSPDLNPIENLSKGKTIWTSSILRSKSLRKR